MATSSSRKPLSQRSLTLLLSGCLLGGQILAGCQMASQRTSDTGMDAMAPQVAETESMPVMPTPDGEIPQEVPDLSQEDYNLIRDNPFQLVRTEPLSTFALDVDSGAYSNVRRFLDDGQLPPADAVRLEEMINYFTYDYPAPDNQPFAINTELSQAPWQPQHQLLRIGIKGQEIENEALPPAIWCFSLMCRGR